MQSHAIVVMSGGQDSVTCLGLALSEHDKVTAVTFTYGQKHAVEIEAARSICAQHGIDHIILDLSGILQQMQSSALVTGGDVSAAHPILTGLPASFVPARNALFLTAAYGIAIERQASVIYTGVCQTDYSGYPDCREEFIASLNHALNIGYESAIEIRTPLMFLTKAQTFALAAEHGFLQVVLDDSVTCYNGEVNVFHPWGKGCGYCPSCALRENGWNEYQAGLANVEPAEA